MSVSLVDLDYFGMDEVDCYGVTSYHCSERRGL